MVSQYVSSMNMDRLMRQLRAKYGMTIVYKSLMMQKQMCPQKVAMTLNNISSATSELKETTSYNPNTKYIHDLTKDGDELSGACAA